MVLAHVPIIRRMEFPMEMLSHVFCRSTDLLLNFSQIHFLIIPGGLPTPRTYAPSIIHTLLSQRTFNLPLSEFSGEALGKPESDLEKLNSVRKLSNIEVYFLNVLFQLRTIVKPADILFTIQQHTLHHMNRFRIHQVTDCRMGPKLRILEVASHCHERRKYLAQSSLRLVTILALVPSRLSSPISGISPPDPSRSASRYCFMCSRFPVPLFHPVATLSNMCPPPVTFRPASPSLSPFGSLAPVAH